MRLLVLTAMLVLIGCNEDATVNGPTQTDPPIESAEDLIGALEKAYRDRDPASFAKLLVNDADRNAAFVFILSEPTEEGETRWGYAAESRAHRRMFKPLEVGAGEDPVPADVRLQAVDITLTPATPFTEDTDLYSQDGGADGLLDPTQWRAESAMYSTDVFFQMLGEVDFQVNGLAGFTVIEDLTKSGAEEGRFLLFTWTDLGSPGKGGKSAIKETAWSQIKGLYR